MKIRGGVAFLAIIFFFMHVGYAMNMLSQPIQLNSSDMEQHGAFVAGDLLNSPLLRSMFNLNVNNINSEMVRVCLNNHEEQCRVVKKESKVYLVTLNGKVSFDDQLN